MRCKCKCDYLFLTFSISSKKIASLHNPLIQLLRWSSITDKVLAVRIVELRILGQMLPKNRIETMSLKLNGNTMSASFTDKVNVLCACRDSVFFITHQRCFIVQPLFNHYVFNFIQCLINWPVFIEKSSFSKIIQCQTIEFLKRL